MTDPRSIFKNNLNLVRCLRLALLSFLIFFSSLSMAASITVKTDRQNVEMGDVITLVIETDFQTTGQSLDTSKLTDQFDILNQQQSNQIEIINGQYASYTRWYLKLLPKQPGNLMIPPFEINGVKSQPYEIKVTKAHYIDGNPPYYLEATTNKNKVFVQEQVIYTLRFFHKGSLINGNIRPPEFKNALVESLKKQSVYGKTIHGQPYTVYEWQYAIFPQASGKLEIPGPSFTGLLHLRGKQKGVQSVAKPITIKVLPAVKTSAPYWLPAKTLTLSEKWQNLPKKIHVGDSLQRIITLEVSGLKATQLPDITTPNGDHYKVYPDQDKDQQSLSEQGVQSIKIISQAIVPTQVGTLQLPTQTLTWWNTETQQMQTTTLTTPPLKIWPAVNAAANTSSANQTRHNNDAPLDTQSSSNSNAADSNNLVHSDQTSLPLSIPVWGWISSLVAVVILWLATLILLIRNQKQLATLTQQVTQADKPTTNQPKLSVDHNWCNKPLPDFYQELLRKLHEELNIQSVDSLKNQRLKEAIFQLEAHLFAGEKLGYDTQQIICDNWAALLNNKHNAVTQTDHLNPLYQNN